MKPMRSMFEKNGGYKTEKVYESTDYGGYLSRERKKRKSDEFASSLGLQCHAKTADNNNNTIERSSESNVIIRVVFFFQGPTAC